MSAESSSPPERPHILVAEDEPTQAYLLRQLLVSNAFEVTSVGDGRSALEELERGSFQMVISDVNMPALDGCAMCQAIKTHPKLWHIPVILLTSLNATVDLLRGLEAGADYYLTKPFEPAYLIKCVRTLLLNPVLSPEERSVDAITVTVEGRQHSVTASRHQMVNLLLSTYESALLQNRQLTLMKRELNERNQQLREQTVTLHEQQRELQRANAQLHALATTDGLTGLNNHRAFQDHLAHELRALEGTQWVSLILLDVDFFKLFNDTFGHQAGDDVLKEVARILQRNARECDFVARYGGEEFVVVLSETDDHQAVVVAERFRRAIESAPWMQRGITASLGVSSRNRANAAPAELIEEADQALYHSKRSGRNRVTYGPTQPLSHPECV